MDASLDTKKRAAIAAATVGAFRRNYQRFHASRPTKPLCHYSARADFVPIGLHNFLELLVVYAALLLPAQMLVILVERCLGILISGSFL